MVEQPTGLGPVQIVIIAFDGGKFDPRILTELRRLREHDAVRLLDLLFVAKDEDGELTEREEGDLTREEAADHGALIGALIGFGVEDGIAGADGDRATAPVASQNGSSPGPDDAWFLADQIPAGTAAAVVLLEHRWALPLRDAIEAAAGHDLVDAWVHPGDLVAIGAASR